jgi:glutamine amidotransferase
MIALVDYGIGNLRSVEKALQSLGAEVERTADPSTVVAAEKVILPGVGAFGDGMRGLQTRGLVRPLTDLVARGVPLLGICLGMQLLFEESEEHGLHQGLGLLSGRVLRFTESGLKVPHTGWNKLILKANCPLFRGLPPEPYAYFNHSFYCQATPRDSAGTTQYGIDYSAAVWRDRLYGVQFHPEKSQHVGLSILQNFLVAC